MKGGKEEESKAMGPLFPRLHVNDTNKGGPRAPPRNKMALCEQFSVPSQRPNSISSISNRPAQISGSLAPSASSNQGFGQEKPHFSSFNPSQQPIVNSSEKVNTNDSGSHASRRPMKLLRRESSVHSKRPQTISESSSARPTDQEPSRKNRYNRSPSRNSNQEPSRRNSNRSPSRNSNQEPSRRNNNRSPSRNSNQEPSRRNNNNIRSPSRRNPNHREDDDFTVPTLLEIGVKIGNKVDNSERESTGRNGNNNLNLNLEERENCDERESEEERDNDLSPDDVVGVIGPKLFLKTRRAIVHQQRIFAVQVFELHRLIKVQQLIAGSPHILLEDLSYLKKPSKPSQIPIPSTNNNLLPPPQEKPHSESPQKSPPKPPSPPKQIHIGSDVANNSTTVRAAPQEPMNETTQSNTNPWYQPNQWLVPVMSPLEGLVYKPYSGPCPPAGSFMAPFFPSCPSVNTPAGGYGVPVQVQFPVPVPVQNVGNVGMVGLPNYFPPFGNMNVVNGNGNPNLNVIPNVSASAVEQVSHLVLSNNNNNVPNRNNNNNGRNNKNGNDNNKIDRNNKEQNNSRSSCNMSQLNAWRMRNCRESELQGSTASSPFEKADNTTNKNTTTNNNNSGFGAQWFPMGMPGMEALANQNVTSGAVGSMPRVIRVVPHNARSATESVARIFQSIQKEKKQN